MKKLAIVLVLSVSLMVLWIAGIMLGSMIFPNELTASGPSGGSYSQLVFFFVCILNASIVTMFAYSSTISGYRLVATTFLVVFGLQYFLSQIETLWFNDALHFPINGILAIVTGGICSSFLFSLLAVWLTGKFKIESTERMNVYLPLTTLFMKRTILLAIGIWPIVYFSAGYFIAWQFDAVRMFYSGSTILEPIVPVMKENIISGLYAFQMIRGFLWLLIAHLVLSTTEGTILRKGVLLGLLFAILGSSGLLLENPYMPQEVRVAHLLETSTSNFIWGMMIARYLGRHYIKSAITAVGTA